MTGPVFRRLRKHFGQRRDEAMRLLRSTIAFLAMMAAATLAGAQEAPAPFQDGQKIVFTGDKWRKKEYAWYTGYPGQHRETAGKRFQRRPELILREAVRRMLPKNKLAFKTLAKLKIYAGGEHPHQAHQPDLKELGITD